MTKSNLLIKVKNLQYRFNNEPLLENVSFSLERGETLAIMGPSGSGKSTLLRVLAGFLKPLNGEVYVSKSIGTVSQDLRLLPHLSAIQNIAAPLIIRGEATQPSLRKAKSMLTDLKLPEIGNRPAKFLSQGQAQRVAFARALAMETELLMLDEPTSALDEENAELILRLLKNWLTPERSILMITHQKEIADWSNRTLRIQQGALETT